MRTAGLTAVSRAAARTSGEAPASPLLRCSDRPRCRLAAKERYDPEGLFFMHHGPGSERWSADGFTRAA